MSSPALVKDSPLLNNEVCQYVADFTNTSSTERYTWVMDIQFDIRMVSIWHSQGFSLAHKYILSQRVFFSHVRMSDTLETHFMVFLSKMIDIFLQQIGLKAQENFLFLSLYWKPLMKWNPAQCKDSVFFFSLSDSCVLPPPCTCWCKSRVRWGHWVCWTRYHGDETAPPDRRPCPDRWCWASCWCLCNTCHMCTCAHTHTQNKLFLTHSKGCLHLSFSFMHTGRWAACLLLGQIKWHHYFSLNAFMAHWVCEHRRFSRPRASSRFLLRWKLECQDETQCSNHY